jgi:hypothetical protein
VNVETLSGLKHHLSPALKSKLTSTIGMARTQLLAVQDPTVIRRIIYLAIRPDVYVEVEKDLSAFLQAESTPGIDIVHYLL